MAFNKPMQVQAVGYQVTVTFVITPSRPTSPPTHTRKEHCVTSTYETTTPQPLPPPLTPNRQAARFALAATLI